MTNTMTNKLLVIPLVLAGMALAAFLFVAGSYTFHASASAPSGLMADTVSATTTPLAMAAVTPLLMAATSTNCSARIIGTGGSAITLTFTNNQNVQPSGIRGFTQAASTTVAYDSGIYGCGALYGFSYVASTVVVTETK